MGGDGHGLKRLGLGSIAYVIQDAHVDAMNNVVGPPTPIRGRPHGVLIPGCSFEARSPTWQRRQ